MMKSFLKKLAFVMALAMVVTTAAPAAGVFAAEVGVIDETKAVVTEKTLAVGETHDFGFAGCDTWAEAKVSGDWGWTSDKEEVATVNYKGEVTGVADGVATITIKVGADYVQSVKVTVGEGEKVEEEVVVETTFEVDMYSDKVAVITTNDETITAESLKANAKFYYYVAANYSVEVSALVKAVRADKDVAGVFYVDLYDGFTLTDGVVYGFKYGEEYSDEFTCVIGNVVHAELKIKDDTDLVVESGSDYVFETVLYNEAGKDITTSALASGVTVEYAVAEDENGKYGPIDDPKGIYFSEATTAMVEVSCYKLDKDNNPVVLVDGLSYPVVAVAPTPYTIDFNEGAVYTIVTDTTSVNWTKATNSKLAVGDAGYNLLVKLADNKQGVVGTNGYFYGKDGKIDTSKNFEAGEFKLVSTNVARLYVTDNGVLVPNSNGDATVLVYFTPVATDEVPFPAAKLVAAVNLHVSSARGVGNTSVEVPNKTLSTKAVNNANVAKVTVKVADTLGDKLGVEGTDVTVKCTTKESALANGAKYPVLSGTAFKVADGKVEFTITANDTTLPTAGKSQNYAYEVKIGNKTETFTITVKAPNTTHSSIALVSQGAKIENNATVTNTDLTVTLAGMSNGVALKSLALNGAKLKVENAVKDGYYYTVTKDGKDITEEATVRLVDGALVVDLTTKKTVNYKVTKNATAEAIQVVDLTQGAGSYKVTVYRAKENSNGKLYFDSISGANQTYKVDNKLGTVNKVANKLAPTFKGSDIEEAVKTCFEFKIGDKTFAKSADYAGYKIAINENFVAGGNVCFINSVTFYQLSKDGATYIDCGTVTVNDYITFTE